MNEARRARVLFVDDSDSASQSSLQELLAGYRLDVRLRHPEETLDSDLAWADVVIADYFLTHWTERDDVASVARQPQNGLAAIAAMRSTLLPPLSERGEGSSPPMRAVAFSLWSNALAEASFNLPSKVLPHVFARENNLEWAFSRTEVLEGDGGNKVAALAQAMLSLPATWPPTPSDAELVLAQLMGLPASGEPDGWAESAWVELVSCRPPFHELGTRTHGLAVVRWLLHRILPYPCFLIDDLQLRARLRVEALEGGSATDEVLLEVLEPFRYQGALAGFDGRRWWRAGVEHWLYDVTDGQSGNSEAVATAAVSRGATTTGVWRRPVVVIQGDLARSPVFVEVEQAVRVRPDDWPVFADSAYAAVEEVQADSYLRALVDPADRLLLDGE